MINKLDKVIVAHPGTQHSFHLAAALKKKGILLKYITTVYYRKNSYTAMVRRILKDDELKRADSRRCEALEDGDVIQFCELRGLLLLLLSRLDSKRYLYRTMYNWACKKFGIKVAKYAIKNQADAVIVFDRQAFSTVKYLSRKNSGIAVIMDMSAPSAAYMKEVYERDMDLCPEFAGKLYKENAGLWNKSIMELYKEELKYPEHFIAASDFVKRSLLYSGIASRKISICPYGADINAGEKPADAAGAPDFLSLIYVGNITAMKGIWYLLEAVMRLPEDRVKLKLVGDYDNTCDNFTPYFHRCHFVGRVTHDKIKDLLLSSDIFVFPSLGDGFGIAPLEALYCGLPCIVTGDSGISDYIINGYNGFVIPAQNPDLLKEKIQWFLDNRDKLDRMKRNAREITKVLTWDNYNKNIDSIMSGILKDEAIG